MDEHDILRHLLQVESEAANLALEAQLEADRRVSERERIAREAYAAGYGERVAALDAEYRAEAASIVAEYARVLEAYRAGFESRRADKARFSDLAAGLLFPGAE